MLVRLPHVTNDQGFNVLFGVEIGTSLKGFAYGLGEELPSIQPLSFAKL
jgi:hypothetical protein